jgi:hypothetical protein
MDSHGRVLWTGDQRNLFRKNAARRSQSIEEIKAAVAKALG